MAKILVCQHVGYEILGTLDPLFKEAGLRIRYVNFGRCPDAQPSIEAYDGLVLLGGPMNIGEADRFPHITHEIKLVEAAIKQKIPVLGICLGAQIIATALGSKVFKNKEKEIGWYPINHKSEALKGSITKHFKAEEQLFQWHGDTFDIPQGAIHLASSPACPNQAFQFGDRVFGFQFHLEVDEAMINRWLQVPHHLEELAALQGKIDSETIRLDTAKHITRLKALSQLTFREFVDLFGIEKRYRSPPSR